MKMASLNTLIEDESEINEMKRIFRYKVYRRLILVYFALIILTVAVLSFFLSSGFSSNYTETIKSNHHNVMQQTLLSIAALSEQLDNYLTHIVTMQDAAFILYGNVTDYLKCYQFYLRVKELCSMESFFRSVIIYNGMTDHILSNGEYPSNLLQILKSNDYRRSRKLFYIEHAGKNMDYEPVFAIVVDPAIFGNVEKTSAVVFFLDKGYMDNRLKALCMPTQSLMVIADDGRIVSHSNPALDYSNYGETELYCTLTAQTQNEGSFQLTEDEEIVQVFYSRMNLFGWTIVSETPLHELTSRMSTTRRQIVIVSIVLASCGCVIGMLLLRRLYFEPVIGLLSGIDEYDSKISINEFQLAREAYTRLQDEMSALRVNTKVTISMLQRNYTYALMHGGQSIANELMGSLSEVNAMIKGPYYCVCLFELEASTREDGSEDYFLDLIETAFPPNTHAALIDWNGTIATMLLQYNDYAVVKEIYSALDSLLERIKGGNIHCSVAVDPDCSDNSHLSESYKYSEQALLYRFFRGWDSIITTESIQQWNQRRCDYPSQEENVIQRAIQTGNIQEIDESIKKIEQKLQEQSYDCVMGHLKRLFGKRSMLRT